MIKVFIINRDLVTWPKKMVEWIQKFPILEPVIVDNNSSYKPTLDWYKEQPCKVHRLNYNGGHLVLHNSGLLRAEVKEGQYIITDPDLALWELPDDTIEKMQEGLRRYPHVHKIGPAIRIDDMPDAYPLKQQVLQWETGFWNQPIGDDYYQAPIDTTFALGEVGRSQGHSYNAIRIGGPYTVRHLPFYTTPETLDDELVYYFTHCDKAVSTQARYLDPMVQNYIRNNNKQ